MSTSHASSVDDHRGVIAATMPLDPLIHNEEPEWQISGHGAKGTTFGARKPATGSECGAPQVAATPQQVGESALRIKSHILIYVPFELLFDS